MKRLIDSVVLLTFLIKQIITLLVQFMLTGNTTRFSETGTRHATRVPGKCSRLPTMVLSIMGGPGGATKNGRSWKHHTNTMFLSQ